jgi:hypothetical protein
MIPVSQKLASKMAPKISIMVLLKDVETPARSASNKKEPWPVTVMMEVYNGPILCFLSACCALIFSLSSFVASKSTSKVFESRATP